MDPVVNAEKSTDRQYAHVFRVTLVHHQLVVLNVYKILNVIKMKLALIKNVVTHARELAELMLNVRLLIIIRFAAVHHVTVVIHSLDVNQ